MTFPLLSLGATRRLATLGLLLAPGLKPWSRFVFLQGILASTAVPR